jgi:hypothetical protein
MIENISLDDYNGGVLTIKVKPFVRDEDGKVLSYIVDAFKDHATNKSIYRESIRFKVTKNNMEVYYGGTWNKFDIYTVCHNEDFTKNYVKEVIDNWWKDKEFVEDQNNA